MAKKMKQGPIHRFCFQFPVFAFPSISYFNFCHMRLNLRCCCGHREDYGLQIRVKFENRGRLEASDIRDEIPSMHRFAQWCRQANCRLYLVWERLGGSSWKLRCIKACSWFCRVGELFSIIAMQKQFLLFLDSSLYLNPNLSVKVAVRSLTFNNTHTFITGSIGMMVCMAATLSCLVRDAKKLR